MAIKSTLLQWEKRLPSYRSSGAMMLPKETLVVNQALGLLKKAEQHQAQRSKEAEEEFQRQKKAGYDAGLEEGKKAATAHHLKLVLASLQYYEDSRDKLVDVVMSCLRQLMIDLPEKERLYQLIGEGLSLLKQQSPIVIQVHPSDREKVEQILPRLEKLLPQGARLEMRTHDELEPGATVLESPIGLIDATLEKQLGNLEEGLRKEISFV